MAANASDEKASSSWKGKKILIVSATLLALSTIFLAYSFTTTWSASTSIIVYSPSLDLKAYWDYNCTDPVTSIDFGIVQKGKSKTVTMYIRNEGNGTVWVYWNSTSAPPTGWISEQWVYTSGGPWYQLNGSSMGAGHVWESRYTVIVRSACPSGQYNWILALAADPL
jgi:hypothetical protein